MPESSALGYHIKQELLESVEYQGAVRLFGLKDYNGIGSRLLSVFFEHSKMVGAEIESDFQLENQSVIDFNFTLKSAAGVGDSEWTNALVHKQVLKCVRPRIREHLLPNADALCKKLRFWKKSQWIIRYLWVTLCLKKSKSVFTNKPVFRPQKQKQLGSC